MMAFNHETTTFLKYATYFMLGILIGLVVINIYDYNQNRPCDFSGDKRNFLFELGYRLEENTSVDVILFPDGKYIETFEYRDKEIIMCDFGGVAWMKKMRIPIEVSVYISKDDGKKSESIYELYEEVEE